MYGLDKTAHFVGVTNQTTSSLVTIFDGNSAPRTIRLSEFGKNFIHFGRDPKNDIVLASHLVSAEHGRFVCKGDSWIMEDKAAYMDNGSTNGLIHNNASIISCSIGDGDFIRIDDGMETVSEGVLIIFATDEYSDTWESVSSGEWSSEYNLNLIFPNIDAIIERSGDLFHLNVQNPNLYINKKIAPGRVVLHEKDVIAYNDVRLVFTSTVLYINKLKSNAITDSKPLVREDSVINNIVEKNTEDVHINANYEENPPNFTQDNLPIVNEPDSYDSDFTDEPIQQDVQYDSNYHNSYQNSSSSATSRGGGLRSFLASDIGYYTLSFIVAIIIWGIAVALWTSQGELALIVILACAIFGWQALNSIQPAMFIWMSWAGWIIYFCVKFILSAIIGLFVAPFKIGKLIAGAISGSMM